MILLALGSGLGKALLLTAKTSLLVALILDPILEDFINLVKHHVAELLYKS